MALFRLKAVRAARVSEVSEATAAAPVPEEDRISFHIGNPLQDARLSSAFLRMALGLATRTVNKAEAMEPPTDVYFATGWGALSETHDFLDKLYSSREFYTSPIDFVGSVHNAPAGQVAMRSKARGPM